MNQIWKIFANMAIPALRGAGEQYKAQDENATGKDDIIGTALVFAADLVNAIINHQPIPKVPDVLKNAQGQKVSL